jgi:RNA-directed DNA polymerase
MAWSPHLLSKIATTQKLSSEEISELKLAVRKLEVSGVAVVLSLGHLSQLTGASYRYLRRVISRKGNIPYRVFQIPKRSGGARLIFEPHPMLMHAQRWILDFILSKISPSNSAYAFRHDRTAVDAARKHCSAKWLVKTDISNFFESVHELSVFKVFDEIGYNALTGFELARICTFPYRHGHPRYNDSKWTNSWLSTAEENRIGAYDEWRVGHLPQGAPTSPALSNLVCRWIDRKLGQFASAHGWEYTRYADDIVFSKMDSDRQEAKAILSYIRWATKCSGFELNIKKTRIVPPGTRKVVLGLLVDGDRPRLPRKFRDELDMHCYYAMKLGAKQHAEQRKFRSTLSFLDYIQGKIAFASQVEPQRGREWMSEFSTIRRNFWSSIERE